MAEVSSINPSNEPTKHAEPTTWKRLIGANYIARALWDGTKSLGKRVADYFLG